MKSLGYVHTPIADHHRWSPYSQRSISTGKGPFSRTTRLMLHQMRWRKPPRQYGLMAVAGLLSILVHVAGVVAMLLIHPPPPPPAEPTPLGQENAIEVRFIDSRPPPPPPAVAPSRVQKTPPRETTPPRKVARTTVRPRPAPPSQAPRQAPVPVQPPARPVTRISVERPVVKVTPLPELPKIAPIVPPKPVKPVARPETELPPITVPPPPKLVLEPSKMSLPPPKVAVTESPPITMPSSETVIDQPIPVERPKLQPLEPEVKVQVTSETPDILPVPSVQITPSSPPASPPTPQIDVGTAVVPDRVQAAPQHQLKTPIQVQAPTLAEVATVTPAPASTQLPPAAPLLAPKVKIEIAASTETPRIDEMQPQLASVPTQVQVATPATVPAPARAESVAAPPKPAPARAESVAAPPKPAPARAVSVVAPPKPAPTSWAQQSDTFSKNPVEQPGHGKADKRQAGRGSPQGVPEYIQRQPRGNSDVMTRHYRGLHYKHTIFEQYWAPDNQGLLTSLLQKLVDALSFKKTFDLGNGVRIHCGGWLLGFGCGGDPPRPPSKLSGDPRLNMAPANPLVPGLSTSVAAPPTPPPVSSQQSIECETARVAGGPLPPGCRAEKRTRNDWN